jgi:cytochrome c oxidase subunit 2
MQSTILAVTLVLMAITAFIFWRVAGAVNADAEPANVGSRRSKLFWTLLVFGVLVTVGSLREWPHAVAAGDDVVQVNATGNQWSWEIDARTIPVGKKVVFNLHTKDVNHGFGVIDQSGRLLFQMQAMPGYINKVKYVFEKPGQYRVLCMEFCGVGHHDMNDEFEVVAN